MSGQPQLRSAVSAVAVKLATSIGADHGVVAEGVAMLRRAGDYHVGRLRREHRRPDDRHHQLGDQLHRQPVGSYNDLCDLMVLAARGAVTLQNAKYALDDFQSAIDDLDAGRIRGRPILTP